MQNEKTETEIYDQIQKLDNAWLSTRSLEEKTSLEEKIKNLYAEAKKFRKPKREHTIDMFEKPKREHREFCTCEICMEELDEYNKRNNTTYQTEFIW